MAAFDLFSQQMPLAKRNRLWAEIINTEGRDHLHHPLNTNADTFVSAEGRSVGRKDFCAPTWAWVQNKYYQAAGSPTQLVEMARTVRVNDSPPSGRAHSAAPATVMEGTHTAAAPGHGGLESYGLWSGRAQGSARRRGQAQVIRAPSSRDVTPRQEMRAAVVSVI